MLDVSVDEPLHGVRVVAFGGEIDFGERATVRDAIQKAISDAEKMVVVDLSRLSFIDSQGIGEIALGLKSARAREVEMAFVRGTPQVQKVFDLTGLTKILDFHPDLDSILKDESPDEA